MNQAKKNNNSILVVDDTPANLKILTAMLTVKGYQVHPALNGELALQAVQEVLPDLILLDIMMPGMDGYEVCRRLKADKRTRDIPVIFLSALDVTTNKVKAFEIGGVDYIIKPFQVEEVLARIKTHLTLQKMQNQLQEQNAQLEQEIGERKRTEARLRLTQFSVDQAGEGIFWLGAQAQILYANAQLCQLLGYSREELLAMTLFDIESNYTPENWPSHWLWIQQRPSTVETRCRSKDGDLFPVEMTFTYSEFEGEAYSFVFVRDIAWRRWAIEELDANEKRYHALFENSPISLREEDFSAVKSYLDQLRDEGVSDFAAYLDDHPEVVERCAGMVKTIDVNQATMEMHSVVNKAELLTDLNQIFGRGSLEPFKRQLVALFRGQITYEAETANYTLGGDRMHIVLRLSIAPGYEKTWAKVLVSIIDITDRKMAEAALQEAQRHLAESYIREQERRRLSDTLRETARVVGSTLDQQEVLDLILTQLEKVVVYHRATIMVLGDNKLDVVAMRDKMGYSVIQSSISIADYPLIASALTRKQPILIPDVSQDDRWIATESSKTVQSFIVAPLLVQNQVLGALGLGRRDESAYTEDDMETVFAFATQVAVALEQARLHELEMVQVERELEIARRIQTSLLPLAPPPVIGLKIACFSQTARQVGGDLYQYFHFDPTRLGIAVGDVSGKGIQAALMMSLSVGMLSSRVHRDATPVALLTQLSSDLYPHTRRNKMNTALSYLLLERKNELNDAQWQVRVANAGLIVPLLRRTDNQVEWLDVGGLPLGAVEGSEYVELEQTLFLGDILVLTTDGVVEANNAAGDMFGFGRLEQAIVAGPVSSAEAMLDYIEHELSAFVGQVEQHDDLTIVVVQVVNP